MLLVNELETGSIKFETVVHLSFMRMIYQAHNLLLMVFNQIVPKQFSPVFFPSFRFSFSHRWLHRTRPSLVRTRTTSSPSTPRTLPSPPTDRLRPLPMVKPRPLLPLLPATTSTHSSRLGTSHLHPFFPSPFLSLILQVLCIEVAPYSVHCIKW